MTAPQHPPPPRPRPPPSGVVTSSHRAGAAVHVLHHPLRDVGNRKRAIVNAFVVVATIVCVIVFEDVSAVARKFYSRTNGIGFSSRERDGRGIERGVRAKAREEEQPPVVVSIGGAGEDDEEDSSSDDEKSEKIFTTEISKGQEREEIEDEEEDYNDDEDAKDDITGSINSVYVQSYAKWMRKQRKNMRRVRGRKQATFFDLRSDCHEKCLNGGKCDYFSGKCECPVGFKGPACEDEERTFPCSDSVELRCSHACDVTRGLCVCGEGTKHPTRVLHQWPFCNPDMEKYGKEEWWKGNGDINDGYIVNKNSKKLEELKSGRREWGGLPTFAMVYGRENPSVSSLKVETPFLERAREGVYDDSGETEQERITKGREIAQALPSWCDADSVRTFDPVRENDNRLNVHPQVVRNFRDCISKCPGSRYGKACEKIVPSWCPNQCSGNGECDDGFCMCKKEFWGADCSLSVPNSVSSSSLRMIDSVHSVHSKLESKRPFIYVYEMPSKFTSHWTKYVNRGEFVCGDRFYEKPNENDNYDNVSQPPFPERPTEWFYSLENTLHEFLLRSVHRTINPENADIFFIPQYGTCYRYAYQTPSAAVSLSLIKTKPGSRPHAANLFLERVTEYIRNIPFNNNNNNNNNEERKTQSYFDRNGGRDHAVIAAYDEGAVHFPDSIANAIFITHWGNTGNPRNNSHTAYLPDNWDELVNEGIVTGSWRAYNRNKDIVAPPWSQPRTNEVRAPANVNGWTPTAERTTLCFFSGNLGLEKPWGEDYSRGLRQTIARSWQNVSGFDILMHSNDYLERIGSSKFCLALPGDGWSGGLSVYIRNGCVPVIVQDGVDMPWEGTFLDYSKFSIRVRERDIENRLQSILETITVEEIQNLQNGLKSVWHLFSYDVPRQPAFGPPEKDFQGSWSPPPVRTEEDEEEEEEKGAWPRDAMESIVDALHFRVYNMRKKVALPTYGYTYA